MESDPIELRNVLRKAAAPAAIALGIACIVRVVLLMRVGDDLASCCLASDSTEYLSLSEGGLFNLSRTPGYPAFLWMARELFGSSPEAALWVQVLLTPLTAALTVLLTALAFPRNPVAWYFAGFLSALSFTGLTLSHFVLAEAIFAPLVSAAILMVWLGSAARQPRLVYLAALFGGLAFLVKPVFVIWPLILPALMILFAERQTLPVRTLVLATILALVIPLGWTLVNRLQFGVLAPSSVGALTGCVYLGGRTMAIVSRPDGPTTADIRAERIRFREGATNFATDADVYRYYSACMMQTIIEHPVAAARAYYANALEALPRPFDTDELRYPSTGSWMWRGIRSIMSRVSDLVYAFALLGALRLIAMGHMRPLAALAILFAAIWAQSALSHAQGARLMYPVEWIVLLLAGIGLELLAVRRPVPYSPSPDRVAAAPAY